LETIADPITESWQAAIALVFGHRMTANVR
jgi:hypothetical protein